ncbi:type II toxin-antitoxin system VapC family toxin [Deinococcus sp.]|uniref:type II toxin-antitoxin system VapC family toxin n=1 Tax=Deinococcus sp. TaxID=47478 RepID=UPI0025BAE702|nr:type II toxin-antitoxin system VapC family toxin [Deinococcus sp.]
MTTLAYLDTNALVKLYLPEAGGEEVVKLLDVVDGVVTSTLSYPESRSVFARALDRGLLGEEKYTEVLLAFEQDWPLAVRIEMTETIYRRAGDLMKPHPRLRTMDAVHLASALEAHRKYKLRFLTFDKVLREAAVALLGKKTVE